MREKTRRGVLTAGAGLVVAASVAGCTGDGGGGTVAAEPAIPGVDDGEVVDSEALAAAHGEQLRERTGTLVETGMLADRGTGEVTSRTVTTVAVAGDRVHAMVTSGPASADGRQELYAEGDLLYAATRADAGWEVQRLDPGERQVRPDDLTGAADVAGNVAGYRVVGEDPASDDGEWYVLRGGARRNGIDDWVSASATVNASGLVAEWRRTADQRRGDDDVRRLDEWRLNDVGETAVREPDWLADVSE